MNNQLFSIFSLSFIVFCNFFWSGNAFVLNHCQTVEEGQGACNFFSQGNKNCYVNEAKSTGEGCSDGKVKPYCECREDIIINKCMTPKRANTRCGEFSTGVSTCTFSQADSSRQGCFPGFFRPRCICLDISTTDMDIMDKMDENDNLSYFINTIGNNIDNISNISFVSILYLIAFGCILGIISTFCIYKSKNLIVKEESVYQPLKSSSTYNSV